MDWLIVILNYGTVCLLYNVLYDMNLNVISLIISIDSTISALDFIMDFVKIPHHPFNSFNPFTMSDDFVNRYMIYTMYILVYYTIHIMTWFTINNYMIYILLLCVCPPITHKLLYMKYIQNIIHYLTERVITFNKYIISHIISHLIKGLCHDILQSSIQLDYTDIHTLLSNQPYSHYTDFIKVFAISTVATYLKNTSIYYSHIVNYLYNYGLLFNISNNIQVKDAFPHIKNTKRKLHMIIQEKMWTQFYNPDILQKLLELYKINNNSIFQDYVKKFIHTNYIYCSRFFATFALLQIIPEWMCIFISCILTIIYYYKFVNNRDNGKSYTLYLDIIIKLSSYIIMMCVGVNSHLVMSLTIEYVDTINNYFIRWLLYKLYKRILKMTYISIGRYIIGLCAIISCVYDIHRVYGMIGLLIMTNNRIEIISYTIIVLCGYISDYNIYHLLCIGMIVWLYIHAYYNILEKDVYLNDPELYELNNIINEKPVNKIIKKSPTFEDFINIQYSN